MADISNLKCWLCQKYLSVPPIMTNKKGENICGRCHTDPTLKGTVLFRNKIYEEAAKQLNFPCFNAKEGCNEIIKIGQAKKHEKGCSFDKYCCSHIIQNKCEWKGPYQKIVSHISSQHPDKLGSNPFVKKLVMTENNVEHCPIYAFGRIFLIKIGQNILKNDIYHGVYMLKENISHAFMYTLDIIGVEGTLNKKFDLLKKGNDISVLKISSLLTILGTLNDVTVRLRVKFKQHKCNKCNVIDFSNIYIEDNEVYCIKCKTKVEINKVMNENVESATSDCPNKSKGCLFKCNNINNMIKHERWFCNYSNAPCKWGCKKKLMLENRFQHYISDYSKGFQFLNNNSFKFYNNKIKLMYEHVLMYNNVRFLGQWSLNQDNSNLENMYFNITIVSELSAKETVPFICKIKLSHDNQTVCEEKELSKCYWNYKSDYWDFFKTIPFNKVCMLYTLEIQISKE